MGFDNDCILNIHSLAGEYFCAVCRTLVYPNEAIQGPCTHLYCKPCLAYVVSTTHACPYDGYRVTEAETKPLLEANKTLADTIGKIQVHCLYYKTGCTWQGSLFDCTSHCSTCGFGDSAVICNKCGMQLKHRQMQEHAQKCYGVHCQVQQPGGVQDNNSTGPTAAPGQTKTAVQTGGPVSQQTSHVSMLIVSSNDASHTVNLATQLQAAQTTTPTAEQVYHQQIQYQQYVEYDPYQQLHRYYYQYPPVLQQYQQPQAQAYPQAYGQPQPLGSSQTQAQTQPTIELQQHVVRQYRQQAQAYPQVYGQLQPLSSSQTRAQTQHIQHAQREVQPLAPNQGAQPSLQSQGQALLSHAPQVYSQPLPLSSSQTQAQTQPIQLAQQLVQPLTPNQGAQPPLQSQGQASMSHAPQVYGQPQPLGSSQTWAQTQPIQQAQQVQPLAPNQGAQPSLQSQGKVSMSHALSSNLARPPSAAHPYTQSQPLPQEQLVVPLYPQTHPWMQHPPLPPYPYPQTQAYPHPQTHPWMQHPPLPPYPYPQTQAYPHQQPQLHSQPHSEPNQQAPVHSSEPIPPSNHPQTLNAVSGYQSYPQPQLHPLAQTSTQHLSNYSKEMQGQYPMQTTQLRAPQSYSNVPNQHQPAMLPPQGPPPSGPLAQQPSSMYTQAQQPGHLFQQRPSVQATQAAFPKHSPFKQHQPSMTGQVHSLGPSQMAPQSQENYGQPPGAHSNAGSPLDMQAVVNPCAQPTGHAGTGQVRPQLNQNYTMRNHELSSAEQLATQSQHVSSSEKSRDLVLEKGGQVRAQLNQNHRVKANKKLSSAEQLAMQSQHVSSTKKPRDQILEKGVHDQINTSKEDRDITMVSSAGSKGDEVKSKAKNDSGAITDEQLSRSCLSGSKQMLDALTKVDNFVQEANPTAKQETVEGVSETPGDVDKIVSKNEFKKANEQDVKRAAKHVADAAKQLSRNCLSGSKQMLDALTKVDSFVQEANPTAKQETVEGVSETPGDVDKIVSKNEFKKANEQDVKRAAKHVADTSGLRKTDLQSQFHGENSRSSIDQRRNQLQPLPYGARKSGGSSMPRSMDHHVKSQQPASLGHTSYRLRPQRHGQAPSSALPLENPLVGTLGSVSAGSLAGNVNYVQDNLPYQHASQPQNPSGDHLVRPAVTTHTHCPGASRHEIDKFGAQRFGCVDKQPASAAHGPIERNSFGHGAHGIQQGAVQFGGPSARDSMTGLGMRDERAMSFFEQHSKHLPHKEFEDDFRKSLRPPHSETRPSNFGMLLPSSGQLDHVSRDRTSRSFDTERHGFDRDPGFGRALVDGLPPRSPAKDYPSFPSRTFGPYEDVGRNESWSFESSKPYNYSAEPSNKPTHESRFPVHARGNLDVSDNLNLGEHFAQNHDSMPSHLQRGGHLEEATAFGCRGGLPRIESPLGYFPSHIPSSESFGGEKPGHSLQGESGFESRQGVQNFREMEHMRKRKLGIMCRICNVECGTVEDLESHSQSREHQRKARDTVVSIKQQNKKMQKVSSDRASVKKGRDGGRRKNSGFQGH